MRFLSWEYSLSSNGNGAVVTLASVFLAIVVVAQDSPSRPSPKTASRKRKASKLELRKGGSMLIDSITSEKGEGVFALWSGIRNRLAG